ncbi:MAG: hypothetical protein JW864_02680 [Spirochaetes bacterium]|nr:hypothetical protein [Spirochaetota bacterium]
MKKYIQQQIDQNTDLNLLYKNVEDIVKIDNNFLIFITQYKNENEKINDEITEFTIEKALSAIYRINQYIDLEKKNIEELKKIYRDTYENLNTNDNKVLLRNHHKKLRQWLSNLYPEKFVTPLSDSVQIGSVVNSEYSADLQIELLDIDIEKLQEPVIDIGSGQNSLLAAKLRKYNYKVYCLDRELKINDKYNIEASWFDYTFAENYWGAGIANMSFSNHFLYTMINEKEKSAKYFSKYNEILNSLKSGGAFIYAPGISAVEEIINKKNFSVFSADIIHNIKRTKIKRISI